MLPTSVLLIEPSAETRAMYAHYLRHHGFAVGEAADVADALPLAISMAPAVIVTELTIPGFDAIGGIRILRRLNATRHARVLACATDIAPVWPIAPGGAEVDGALEKPVAPRVLLAEVRYLLGGTPAVAAS